MHQILEIGVGNNFLSVEKGRDINGGNLDGYSSLNILSAIEDQIMN